MLDCKRECSSRIRMCEREFTRRGDDSLAMDVWVCSKVCPNPETQRLAPFSVSRRGGGAVERGGLENRCGREPTVGSNPTPSAK